MTPNAGATANAAPRRARDLRARGEPSSLGWVGHEGSRGNLGVKLREAKLRCRNVRNGRMRGVSVRSFRLTARTTRKVSADTEIGVDFLELGPSS